MSFFLLARLAYRAPIGPVLELVREVDYQVDRAFYSDTKSDAQYFTLVYEDKLVFALRGSSSPSDFLADARIFMTPMVELGPGVMVHRGFYSQYNSIKFDIMASIITYARKRKNSKIVFVGHSLGGALATLCAAAAKCELGNDVRVHCETYGSPRVGNATFVSRFDELVDNSVRLVNANDAVTLMPRPWYGHVKGLQEIGLKSSSVWSVWFGSVQDHYLENYDKALL